MKVNLKNLFYRVIMLFPITTLFSYYFDAANKILFAVLFVIMIYIGYRKIKKSVLRIVFILTIIYFITILKTGTLPYNINELFYFPFMVLYLTYLYDHLEALKEYLLTDKKYVNCIMKLWTVLTLVSFALPSSYTVEWGGARYFGSYCKTIWRLAPTCVFMLALSIIGVNLYKNKKYFLYSIIPFVAILAGGSRTYVVVALCLILLAWYCVLNSNKKFILTCIPFLTLIILVLLNSSVMDKFSATTYSSSSYFDFWGTITSGRSIFWAADINSFVKSPIITKLFGQGFNSIYDINYKAFGGKVWAHNDFIQCLISHGLVGLILYLTVIFRFFKMLRKNGTGLFISALVMMIWLFNAMFNMFYTYFCSILSFPLLVLGIIVMKKGKEMKDDICDNTQRI